MNIEKDHNRGYYYIQEENIEKEPIQPHNRLLDDVYNGVGCNKLNVYDWLSPVKDEKETGDNLVEVRFKNTHKGIFNNDTGLILKQGDLVAVEASPGHDIGVVSLVGGLVKKQCCKYKDTNYKKIYRKARPTDIEKWKEARRLEYPTMLKARVLARELNLNMKIGDVEYQGDKTKAIFYYIADERVDFRQLIKRMAEEFKIRIEMRQIGARQEAGAIGGIGPCGKALCCSKWLSNFTSVSTNTARLQELSLNPQKLAGQCGKLKCCLNFEAKVYEDARKKLPDRRVVLETEDGFAYYQKSDILSGVYWYSSEPHSTVNMVPIKVDRVKEIISLNKKGVKADSLIEDISAPLEDFSPIVGQDSLTRFDKPKKSKKNAAKRKRNTKPEGNKNGANSNRNKSNSNEQKANQGRKFNNEKKRHNHSNSSNKSNQKPTNKSVNKPNRKAEDKPKSNSSQSENK